MTLAEFSKFSKRMLVIVIVVFLGLSILFQITKLFQPKPEIPNEYKIANEKCGNLPSLRIKSIDNNADFSTIRLETTTGKFPDLPKIINVYSYDYKGISLAAKSQADNLAKSFGFDTTKAQKIGEFVYEYQNSVNGKTLRIDISTQNFDLTTNIRNVDFTIKLNTPETLKTYAYNILNSKDILPNEVDLVYSSYSYLTNVDGSLKITSVLQNAKANRIYLVKSKGALEVKKEYIDYSELGEYLINVLPDSPTKVVTDGQTSTTYYVWSIPLVSDQSNESNIYMDLIGPSYDSIGYKDVINIHFNYWPITTRPCGTHYTIGEEQAFENIKNGKGYLIELKLKQSPDTVIDKTVASYNYRVFDIKMGYFDIDDYIEGDKLQPIYIFSGEAETDLGLAEFKIYTEAVK